MSSGQTRGGNPNKGGSKSNNNSNNKQSKSDLKTDKQPDLNAKIQPTAEQMQIARIMDSHRSEDPELQKKIKQVMEITRASEDEACMALHSREYDTAQAITLLTDGSGQLLSSEWAQAGKKKKTKTPGSKADGPPTDKQRGTGKDGRGERSDKRDTRGDRPERDSKDSEADDGQATTGNDQSRREDRGRGGDRGGDRDNRGRGSRRGGRGRGSGRAENKENDEVSGSRSGGFGVGSGGFGVGSGGFGVGSCGFGGRMANGPGGRGRGGGGIGRGRGLGRDGRTFASRTRGSDDEQSSYHPIDVWENSQAETPEKPPLKVDKWDEFPSAEDWDNEEYTGSLQETKVFTPSTQTQVAPPLGDTTNGGPNHLGSSVSSGLVGSDAKISSVGSGDALGESSVVGPTGPVVPGQSIDLSLLLQKPPNSSSVTKVSNAGANLLATLQSSYSNSNPVQMSNANQPLPPRHKVQRPRGPTTKIPSSAVEMPVDSVTTLDVQFGGLEFDDNSSMTFNSVMHGSTKSNAEILYGSPPTKIDSFSAADKESLKQSEPQAPSPFQRNSQSSIVETVSSVTVPISPNIDSHSLTLQNQIKNSNPPQSSYVNSNVVSAFVSYGKGAPGFPAAPGFAPVAQPPPPGTVSYSNSNSPGGAVTATSYSTSSNSQTSYHNNMGSLSYGNQPVVSAVLQPSQIQTQPIIASASQSSYSGTVSQTPTQYHHTNAVYGNNTSGSNQYGTYGQKLQNALSAQNASGHQQTVKDSSSESNSSVPASGSSSANSVQMGSLQQQGPVIVSTSSSNPKISSSSNVPTSAAAKMGIPPGMVMQPQYILNQSGVPAFYSIQPSFYGFDENMQILPRIPAHLQGYYDPNAAANYGNPMSFALEANAGVQGGPGVSTRNDGTTLPSFSGGSDARFPRSDSSTASPVPSNIAGQSTQQPMYNPGLPGGYYFVGNNMMHAGTHFPYAPPHMYPTTAMATPTNASGAPHAATANHQYQSKGVYNPSYSYDGPQGPSTDFSKNSYAGGPGVGPNSNSGKSASSTPSGTSQTTDLNTSMYGKGHLNKINSYEKPYVNSGGGYNALGAGANPLNSQLSGAGIGAPYGVYIAQPVQPLPLPQDGSNVRQGTGQPKGNKQQYGAGPYWPN